MGALQHRRAVDQLNALHYMHTNMLRVPLMHVVDSRDVQASVAPMSETLRTCRARCRSLAGSLTAVAMAGVGHQRLLARLGAIVLHTPPPPSRTAVMEIDRVQQEEERL